MAPPASWFTISYTFNGPYHCVVSLHELVSYPSTPQILQVAMWCVLSRSNYSISTEGSHLCLCTKRCKSICTHPGGQTQPETQGRCAEKVRFSSWFSQVLSLLSSGSTCGLLQLIEICPAGQPCTGGGREMTNTLVFTSEMLYFIKVCNRFRISTQNILHTKV